MKISIVIPTYEYGGKGVEMLDRLIWSLSAQSFTNYEVIISDHSVNSDIMDYCLDEYTVGVIYHRNKQNIGNSSANLNNAIRYATGEIIKPMFQDDWFYDNFNALSVIHNHFEHGAKWVVVGNNTFTDEKKYHNDFIPSWNDDIVFGHNTLSSPSCMAYLRCDEQWDERLVWLMDCEFYHRLYTKFGEPTIDPRILVTNYGHPLQYTHLIPNERKQWEVDLMRAEHGV